MLDPSEFFAPDGTLARVHPAYEHRQGQQAMARAVREHFDSGRQEEMRHSIAEENEKYSWERMTETVEKAYGDLKR